MSVRYPEHGETGVENEHGFDPDLQRRDREVCLEIVSMQLIEDEQMVVSRIVYLGPCSRDE